MKYAIVIPDGAADDPCPALGGRTPLEAARLPNMDRIARSGICGLTNNVPPTLTPASDVATLSLFGYDALEVYTGRAPLEAAALGVTLGPHDWAIRCNLVYVADNCMRDFTAGHISSEEGRQLIDALRESLPRAPLGNLAKRLELVTGVGYRNLLIYRGDAKPVLGDNLKSQPPHDIPDRPIANHQPGGTGSHLLQIIMDWSRHVFADHSMNQRRRAAGKRDATQVWLWGQGRAPKITKFLNRYGKRGAITSGVDLVRGVGALLGWDRLEAPGITDYLDNDYVTQGRLAVASLDKYDLVCVHVEAPDEASHEGLADEKVKALEHIDANIVGPLLDALPKFGDWRILVSPDHRTPLTTRSHSHGAVPFAVMGTGIDASGAAHYDEQHGTRGTLRFDPGWTLMECFLKN
jgi:2,3-bisphosphoglycerate-independent phosphoglycerate mutase